MSDISEWSTIEAENTHIDELTLSGESGQYINKVMCAVKSLSDDIDDAVVHKTGDESVGGAKTFVNNPAVATDSPGVSFVRTGSENTKASNILSFNKEGNTASFLFTISNSENVVLSNRYNKSGAVSNGASFSLLSAGGFSLQAKKGSEATAYVLEGSGDGSLLWNGQELQTSSDERLKTPLSAVPDEVLDAWGDVNWGQFQFLAAVSAKGETARLHMGVIAQRVKTVFEEHGLDACRYGILCHVEKAEDDGAQAVDVWTVRYAEALAMEAACQRRRADRLEARIEALEAAGHGID